MDQSAGGFGFWCKDGSGCIDKCAFAFFLDCFAEELGCESEATSIDEVLAEFDNGDCCLKKYEWKNLIRTVCSDDANNNEEDDENEAVDIIPN